jgi:hypothetical protein
MDIFDLLRRLLNDTEALLQVAVVVIALIFFLVVAIQSKFSVGKTILAFLIAAFVIWVVFNIDFGRDLMDDTINPGAPAQFSEPAPSF